MNTSNQLVIFSFNGANSIPEPFGAATMTSGFLVAWSPDGRFIAGVNSGNLNVYSCNGGFITSVATASVSGTIVLWSPGGQFISVMSNSGVIQMFKFNGVNALTPVGNTTVSGITNSYGGAWSPDGRFLAISNYSSPGKLQILSFNGREAPTLVGSAATTANNVQGIGWSPDGRFISVSSDKAPGVIQIFAFNGSSTPTQVGGNISVSGANIEVPWSPDGKYIAVLQRTNSVLQVFKVNYLATNPNPQVLSNSIVFGNSALGSSYDLNARVLAGSQIVVDGLLNDDNVN